MKKMWALMVILSQSQWWPKKDSVALEDDIWEAILEESGKSGINAILLDVGDGVVFKSYPELSVENAWSEERVKKEVNRCRDLGIELIPKLNFSSAHNFWLCENRRMVSTPEYNKMYRELLAEIYDMFDHPEYLHIGMDEENDISFRTEDVVVMRKPERLIHDVKVLIDEVKKLGAKPWMWADPLQFHTKEYQEQISPDEVLLSPWYYYGYKEGRTPIENFLGKESEWYIKGYRYMEDIPTIIENRQILANLMHHGYKYVPCASIWASCDENTADTIAFYMEKTPSDEQIEGFMTAPWCDGAPKEEKLQKYMKSIRLLKEAREKFFK